MRLSWPFPFCRKRLCKDTNILVIEQKKLQEAGRGALAACGVWEPQTTAGLRGVGA